MSGSEKNGVGDMEALGIYESLQLKRQVLLSASEAAEMIVRVDEVVQCALASVFLMMGDIEGFVFVSSNSIQA